MKIIHGTPDSVFAIGVGLAHPDAKPMPYIVFASKKNTNATDKMMVGEDSLEALEQLVSAGSTVIFFDNPDSFNNVLKLMRLLNETTSGKDRVRDEKPKGMMQ